MIIVRTTLTSHQCPALTSIFPKCYRYTYLSKSVARMSEKLLASRPKNFVCTVLFAICYRILFAHCVRLNILPPHCFSLVNLEPSKASKTFTLLSRDAAAVSQIEDVAEFHKSVAPSTVRQLAIIKITRVSQIVKKVFMGKVGWWLYEKNLPYDTKWKLLHDFEEQADLNVILSPCMGQTCRSKVWAGRNQIYFLDTRKISSQMTSNVASKQNL